MNASEAVSHLRGRTPRTKTDYDALRVCLEDPAAEPWAREHYPGHVTSVEAGLDPRHHNPYRSRVQVEPVPGETLTQQRSGSTRPKYRVMGGVDVDDGGVAQLPTGEWVYTHVCQYTGLIILCRRTEQVASMSGGFVIGADDFGFARQGGR